MLKPKMQNHLFRAVGGFLLQYSGFERSFA